MRRTAGDFRSFGAACLYFVGYAALVYAAAYSIVGAFPSYGGLDYVGKVLFCVVVMLAAVRYFDLLSEVARLLCIPVAGWRFVSFRFGQGLLLDPPAPVNGKYPCVCYLLCGGGSSLLIGLLLLGIGFFMPIGDFLRCFGFLELVYAWGRLFPHRYGERGNDGYWLLRIRKDPRQSAVLWLHRKLAVEMTRAETYADFSEETVKALMEYECGNFGYGGEVVPLYFRAHYLFAQGDREGASAVYRMIAESAASDEMKGRAYCELFYAAILDGVPKEELSALYQKSTGSKKRTKDNTARRRLMVAVRLLYEKDENRAEEEYQALLRLCRTEPFRAQAALDLREARRVRALYGSGSDTEVVSKNTAQVEIKHEGEKTSKKSLILSSILPSLSVILSIALMILLITGGEFMIADAAFIIALGIVCGGAVPLFLIIVWKADISVYWIGKTILFGLFWAGFAFTWFVIPDWTFHYALRLFLLPILILIAEILFAATRKTDLKTRLCLILSGPIWLYVGFAIDLLRALARAIGEDRP